jgi:hypothetical protein
MGCELQRLAASSRAMIWADRAGIVWLGIALFILLSKSGWQIEGYFLVDILIGVGIPWAIMRALDFLFVGRVRRL